MALASNASEARLNATLDMLERLIGFDTEVRNPISALSLLSRII